MEFNSRCAPFLIKALLYLFAWLPLPVSHALGSLVGLLMSKVPSQVRTVTRTIITLCYPNLTHQEHQRLVSSCLREKRGSRDMMR